MRKRPVRFSKPDRSIQRYHLTHFGEPSCHLKADSESQKGDPGYQNGETCHQKGDREVQKGDTGYQNGETCYQKGDREVQKDDTG
ncbi:hypothetical protein M3O96_08670 [Aquiflexum sp. TKW24L]|uniref:hypothetical protein n=1 Tax=Aquiflexum sp. TKW24L TaxID=2942212 RepID=UPI0020BE046D|nr:hypothetical protein [Aquiflexum sp. TKW24L]MCL6259158.1 hypothetical protein [Aquiflexum sp. TKW24L]